MKNVELHMDEPLEGHITFQHMPSLRLRFSLEDCDGVLAMEQKSEIDRLVKLMNQYYATKNGG